MKLYRVFPWNPGAKPIEPGGALYAPRDKQGQGRHDIPHLDGVYYCSLSSVSAVSEFLQVFRGQTITAAHFSRREGLTMAIAEFTADASLDLIDLDDPKVLSRLSIRPSQVLTRNRKTTRELAERLHKSGHDGLLWPSVLEASWINATLFQSRVEHKLIVSEPVRPLTLRLPEVIEASKMLGLSLE